MTMELMDRLRRKEPVPPWTVRFGLGLVLVYIAARIAALAIVSVIIDVDAASAGVVSPLTTNVAANMAGLVVLGLTGALISRRTAHPADALRLRAWPGSALLVMLFSLGVAVLVDFVPLLFETIGLPVNMIGLEGARMATWLLAALFSVVVKPLTEMLLLAGVLYPARAARRGGLSAILLVALAFMVLQALDSPGDLALWIESFLSGLYLGGVRAHQESTRAAILAASMFGLFALFKALRLFL